jgi:hypothetical protein
MANRFALTNVALGTAYALLVTLLSGCSTYDPVHKSTYEGYSIQTPGSGTLEPYSALRSLLIKKDSEHPSGSSDGLIEAKCFAPNVGDASDACLLERNEAIAALMIGSEAQCLEHRRSIYGNDAGYNVTLGTAAGLFAGAASVLTKTHPYQSSILGALSAFSISERALVNETIYKTMIVSAVDKKILDLRDTKAQAIKAKFNSSLSNWPVNQALADWVDFHSSCSFITGLQLALAEGTQGADLQRMAKLKANFDNVSSQYTLNKCASAADNVVCQSLADQLSAVSEALKQLAVK